MILTALSGILYGCIGYFGATLMNNGLSLYDMLMWRFLAAALCFAPLLPFVCKRDDIDIRALFRLLLLGAIFYGAGTAFYFAAGRSIGTGLAMVLFYSYPIFVVGFSCFTTRTLPSRWVVLSLVLIVVGCVLIAFGNRVDVKVEMLGVGLALVSGFAYGCYVISSRHTSRLMSPILSTFVVCLGSTIVFLPSGLVTGSFYWPTTSENWVLITCFGLFGTALPVLLLQAGMKQISATKASIMSVLEPVTILLVGATILNESVSGWQIVGAATVLGSALVVQLDRPTQS